MEPSPAAATAALYAGPELVEMRIDALTRAESTLGDLAVAAQLEAGRRLKPEEAVELALAAEGPA